MAKYAIGLDYGTLSGRAVLVNLETGAEDASSVFEYPHGVMDERLPCGKPLGEAWALQHPRDYLDVLARTIPDVLEKSGAAPDDVVGVGVDFTACTILPVKKDGTPLCFYERYREEPHAYVKLWKHHAAQPWAERLNRTAAARGEAFLRRYGGKTSEEWLVPKAWQLLEEAPALYEAADRIIEAGDWVIWQLTGNETRNACAAGYKSLWHKREGFPSPDFFRALHPGLEHFVSQKLGSNILPAGTMAGAVTKEAAKLTGLLEGTPVSAGNIDAHAAMPAVGITGPGKLMMIIGTSTCHMLLDENEIIVPGMSGVVEDGIIPGFLGYEAGQACVGDHFDWFTRHCVSEAAAREAREAGLGLHAYLRQGAKALRPGESGLLALDWWNGNRSVLSDSELSGLFIGMTLATPPEELYRALLEATAYGTRMILDAFEESGVSVRALYACGGIAQKDELMMQIYADVTGRSISVSAAAQAPAVGSAMFGAVAAGYFKTIREAAQAIVKPCELVYTPDPGNAEAYNALYREYRTLHDYFGRGGNDVMKRLLSMKRQATDKS